MNEETIVDPRNLNEKKEQTQHINEEPSAQAPKNAKDKKKKKAAIAAGVAGAGIAAAGVAGMAAKRHFQDSAALADEELGNENEVATDTDDIATDDAAVAQNGRHSSHHEEVSPNHSENTAEAPANSGETPLNNPEPPVKTAETNGSTNDDDSLVLNEDDVYITLDTDGDGVIDTAVVDVDMNGIPDVILDTSADGNMDTLLMNVVEGEDGGVLVEEVHEISGAEVITDDGDVVSLNEYDPYEMNGIESEPISLKDPSDQLALGEENPAEVNSEFDAANGANAYTNDILDSSTDLGSIDMDNTFDIDAGMSDF